METGEGVSGGGYLSLDMKDLIQRMSGPEEDPVACELLYIFLLAWVEIPSRSVAEEPGNCHLDSFWRTTTHPPLQRAFHRNISSLLVFSQLFVQHPVELWKWPSCVNQAFECWIVGEHLEISPQAS